MVANYEDLLRCKPKSRASKKEVAQEENKYKPSDKQAEVKILKSKVEAPKTKGIIIKSPARDQIQTPPSPVIGKGKGKVVDLPPPPKRPHLEAIPKHGRPSTTPKLGEKMEKISTQQCLLLNKNVGASGAAMAVDLGTRMAKTCSALSAEVWEHFKTDEHNALLDLGIVSSVVVSTHSLSLVL